MGKLGRRAVAAKQRGTSQQAVDWVITHWWAGGLAIFLGVATMMSAFILGSHDRPLLVPKVINGNTTTTQSFDTWWLLPAVLLGALLLGIGVAALVTWDSRRRFRDSTSRTLKIERPSAALAEALVVIQQVKVEVETGKRVMAELERDTDVKRRLANLSSQEASAVLAQLQETVRVETNRGTLLSILIATVFLCLECGVHGPYHSPLTSYPSGLLRRIPSTF